MSCNYVRPAQTIKEQLPVDHMLGHIQKAGRVNDNVGSVVATRDNKVVQYSNSFMFWFAQVICVPVGRYSAI
jgi:hypothetical protein